MTEPVFSVVDAVAALNQTLSTVYPRLTVVGELDSFKVAKGKWVYADLKDEYAKLRLFGTVFQLPGPLEDGMMVEVVAEPRLHPQFGFSLNMQSIRPVGEGSLKKAADKLLAKLTKEGLFDPERKRILPFPPEKIALVTADGSAALADFMKITKARWPLLTTELFASSVQGANAPEELVRALSQANESSAEAIVMIRGGGSADDLSAFSDERVVRAVASSRLPTLVAIGHEVDISLAEIAADMSASTPSNAAEILVPDQSDVLSDLKRSQRYLQQIASDMIKTARAELTNISKSINQLSNQWVQNELKELQHSRQRFDSYHPRHTLARGYALLKRGEELIKATDTIAENESITIERANESRRATVE